MSIDAIYQLEKEESTLLFSETVNEQLIEVREWNHFRWLQIGGDLIQSLMETKHIERIALPNIGAQLLPLAFQENVSSFLNLGLGGGSIERFVSTYYPHVSLTSVESEPTIINIAKDYFQLPENVDVVHSKAEEFVQNNTKSYDIILCDMFEDEQLPGFMYQDSFYSDLNRCLSPKGTLAMNLLPESEQDVVSLVLPMKDYFEHISLLEIPNHDNVVIYASHQALPESETCQSDIDQFYNETKLDLRDLPGKIVKLVERLEF